MDKITEYLDGTNKHKNAKQQHAKSVVKEMRKHMKENHAFVIFDDDEHQLTDEDLKKLEARVIDFYEEDEEDN